MIGKLTMTMVAIMTLAASAHAKVTTRPLSWESDGVKYAGALVFDSAKLKKAKGKLPGVLIVHQYMGPTANETMRANMLAELGYVAFVADVYGIDTRPTDHAGAMAAASKLKGDRAELRKRLKMNLDTMIAQPEVDGHDVAAIGYCFGGTAVLELARSGADVRGVVSFHGGLDSPTPADGANIRAKVLVLHGAADPYTKAADVQAFIAELDQAKVDWQMVSYSGAVHAFTQKEAGDDASKGAAYNAAADRRSWSHMQTFLSEVLAP